MRVLVVTATPCGVEFQMQLRGCLRSIPNANICPRKKAIFLEIYRLPPLDFRLSIKVKPV
jgi:hypothetical protein